MNTWWLGTGSSSIYLFNHKNTNIYKTPPTEIYKMWIVESFLLKEIFQISSFEFQRHGKYPKWIQYVIYCSNTNIEFTIANRCRINSSKEIEDKKLMKIHNGVLFAQIPMYQSDIHGRLDVILCATFIENAFFR